MDCVAPKCASRKRPRKKGRICVLPNPYTMFRSLNAGVTDVSYQDAKPSLIPQGELRCNIHQSLAETRKHNLTYRQKSTREQLQQNLQDLRTKGYTVFHDRVSDASVKVLTQTAQRWYDIYEKRLQGFGGIDALPNDAQPFREISNRNGRVDLLVPDYKTLLAKGSHPWLNVCKRYLQDITDEQVAELTNPIDDDDAERNLRIILSPPGERKARVLTSGVLEALPGSPNQQWHVDPLDLWAEPYSLLIAIAFDDITLEDGPTEVFEMSTSELYSQHPAHVGNMEGFMSERQPVSLTVRKGQVYALDPRCIHRGGANVTNKSRILSYFVLACPIPDDDGELSYLEVLERDEYHPGESLVPDMILGRL